MRQQSVVFKMGYPLKDQFDALSIDTIGLLPLIYLLSQLGSKYILFSFL